MATWEYNYVSSQMGADGFTRFPIELFNALGLASWELVATDCRTFAVFKRPSSALNPSPASAQPNPSGFEELVAPSPLLNSVEAAPEPPRVVAEHPEPARAPKKKARVS